MRNIQLLFNQWVYNKFTQCHIIKQKNEKTIAMYRKPHKILSDKKYALEDYCIIQGSNKKQKALSYENHCRQIHTGSWGRG